MNPQLYKFPLDLTGRSTKNRVNREMHDIGNFIGVPFRPFVMDNGYFFVDDLHIEDSTGYVLAKDVDYQVTGLNAEIVSLSGREVCSVIVITNPRIADRVFVGATMVGGVYSDVSPTIAQLADTLLNDTRSVRWTRIEGKPDKFAPSGHLHAFWDLYGFEPYCERIDHITDLILAKSRIEIDALYADLIARYTALRAQRTDTDALMLGHINNTNNPHQTTAAQVDLGSVPNYPVATQPEASVVGGDARNDRMMTPLRVKNNIDVNFGVVLNNHIGNTNNPHQVTAVQADAYTTAQINTILQGLLGINETAVGTRRLQGMDYPTIKGQIRANIDASSVTTGRFPPTQIATGGNDGSAILHGMGDWNSVAAMVAFFNSAAGAGSKVYYVGWLGTNYNSSISYVTTTFADNTAYPPGTIVIYREGMVFAYNGGNAAAQQTQYNNAQAMMKTESGWLGPYTSLSYSQFHQGAVGGQSPGP